VSEIIRLIRNDELSELLSLYKQLQPEDPDVYANESLKDIWNLIYNDSSLYYIVAGVDGKIVYSCNISIIKNLTRNLP